MLRPTRTGQGSIWAGVHREPQRKARRILLHVQGGLDSGSVLVGQYRQLGGEPGRVVERMGEGKGDGWSSNDSNVGCGRG